MLRNKQSALIALIAVLFVAIGTFIVFFHRASPPPADNAVADVTAPVAPQPILLPSAPAEDLAIAHNPRPAEKVPAVPAPASPSQKPRLVVNGVYNPPLLEGPHAAELTRIQDLSVTYDAREVPALADFLTHDSAEVRAAAIDGLIRLGSKEAAEPLRAAAGKVKDPREAIAMLDAADYLELPPMPASMLRKRKESKATAAPSPAPSEPKKTTAENGG
jgi:hypothetical protein